MLTGINIKQMIGMRETALRYLLAGIWVSCLLGLATGAQAATYYVDGACPTSGDGSGFTCGPTGPFQTIQEGVDAASSGDTAIVASGTYYEQVTISTDNIALQKESGGTVTIDGRNAPGTGLDDGNSWSLANCSGTNDCYSAPYLGAGQVLWTDGLRCDLITWDEAQNSNPQASIDQDNECWVDTAGGRAWIQLPGNDDPNNHLMQTPERQHGIYVNGANNVSVDGIDIIGTYQAGFHLWRGDNVTYKNAVVTATGFSDRGSTGFTHRGVNIRGAPGVGDPVKNALVQNVIAQDVGRSGFTFIKNVEDSVIERCVSRNNLYHNGFDNLGDAGESINSFRNVVRNSEAYGNAGPGVLIQGCDSCVIEGNRLYDNVSGILVQPPSGGTLSANNIVRNNFVYNNSHGIIVNNEVGGVIYNNTSYNNEKMGVAIAGGSTVTMKNNILANNQLRALKVSGESGNNAHAINSNLYWGSSGSLVCWGTDQGCNMGVYATLAEFQAVFPAYEANGLEVDPQLVDPASFDFHLQETSPAIDAGAALAEVTTDFEGDPRPQGAAWDIGADEYVPISVCALGDVNCDGTAGDSSDIQLVVNVRLGLVTDQAVIQRADLNSDTNVDAADIQAIVNMRLGV